MIYVFWGCICSALIYMLEHLKGSISLFPTSDNLREEHTQPTLSDFVLVLIAMIPLFLIGALRFDVGTDYETYLRFQIPYALRGALDTVGFLYGEIIKFGVGLGSTQYVFVLTQLILIVAMAVAIYKLSSSYSTSVFLFMFSTFFSFSLNVMRQSIGTAVAMAAIYFLFHNKVVFALLSLVAVSLHSSVIVLIVLMFVALKKLPLGFFILISPIAYLVAPITIYLMQLFPWILGRFSYYVSVNYSLTLDRAIAGILFLTLGFCWASKRFGWIDDFDSLTTYLIRLTGWGLAVLLVLRQFPNAARLAYLFLPIQIILVPRIISSIKDSLIRILSRFFVLAGYTIFFIVRILILNYNETIPYQILRNWNF
ncbi:EpsG family protein [Lacticaseibacillus paracasei]|uniref:EpsG family protein n=2 Tax=Lacticaseibacillus paracasei TaxID=1597 RepID=UPI00137749EB|nr:EpsG family protein [Lacticaseibacillus paracasei]MCZ2766774.1 EpsG family protein [Lacticaseibacillus paracasei]MCZ2769726.1 EpsG family protein [Lacticaseibacillus paracasei]MCZ2775215.1 EpsG family protein [Lacticaseibacillus paracasei]MCZ2778137.1 EpsG family protein [Lacticaseibacillus paracasei]MCZ2784374.1 EpsG family protein [Lacticaseibacillus paracasei]